MANKKENLKLFLKYLAHLEIFSVCMCTQSLSQVGLFETLWTVAHQAPLSMEFFKQEYRRGLLFPSPGDLPDPGIEPVSPAPQANVYRLSHQESPFQVCGCCSATQLCRLFETLWTVAHQASLKKQPLISYKKKDLQSL